MQDGNRNVNIKEEKTMLSIEEKSRAYKLAHALKVAAFIQQKAAITVPEALRLALQIHPLEWWLWELRMHKMFEGCTYQVACAKLRRLADGHPSESYGSDDLFPEHISESLENWVSIVNDEGHLYEGEVAFVDLLEDDGGFFIYTYDPHPEDSIDSVLRVIEKL